MAQNPTEDAGTSPNGFDRRDDAVRWPPRLDLHLFAYGFYQAEVRNRQLVLRYLHRAEIGIALADIEAVRVTPAFKGRWRLHVRRAGNGDYESAAGSRDQIHNAAERLRLAMPKLR